jgi:hypothetical protein
VGTILHEPDRRLKMTWSDAYVLRAGADTTERQTVTVASLTLALLWDPKETGLAD